MFYSFAMHTSCTYQLWCRQACIICLCAAHRTNCVLSACLINSNNGKAFGKSTINYCLRTEIRCRSFHSTVGYYWRSVAGSCKRERESEMILLRLMAFLRFERTLQFVVRIRCTDSVYRLPFPFIHLLLSLLCCAWN